MEFDFAVLGDHFFRLAIAAAAGGVLGLDREFSGQWAGLRTHMVVAVASAIFVLLAETLAEGDPNAASRVVSGVATGVGFLGAGTILKLSDSGRIKGLTTASSIWLAAGLGSVAGFGRYELMVAGTVMAIVILAVLKPLSDRIGDSAEEKGGKKKTREPAE